MTKPHLHSRKHSTKVDTNPPYSTNQPNKSNGNTDNATTSSGTTPGKNTSTNIGYQSLALLDKHFPKDHKLSNIFNRNNIKVSYGCRTTRNKSSTTITIIYPNYIYTLMIPASVATINDNKT